MPLQFSETRSWRSRLASLSSLAIMVAGAAQAHASVPVSGMPIPELAVFDQAMCDFMDANDINGGILGIMRNGEIVYQRGFGWKDEDLTVPLRHDAMMRLASVTKPISTAAVRHLIANSDLSETDYVFDLGQEEGGVLEYTPFGDLVDERYEDITVEQLYFHTSGLALPNGEGDPTYNEIDIAEDMGVGSPPSRYATVRWIMGNSPLVFDPGDDEDYSNVGFLVLGLLLESQVEVDHFTYVREEIFGPMDWMPLSDIVRGRTFSVLHDPREPYYESDEMVPNVFDPNGPNVRRPEGGWDHEARVAQGGMVASTTALLHFAENYYVNHDSDSYGLPTNGVRDDLSHSGSLTGTHAMLRQRSDGVNFAVVFNKRGTDVISDDLYSIAMRDILDAIIDNGGFDWPEQGIDGQWIDLADPQEGDGAFERPWNAISTAASLSPWEATLNIKPSESNWTGTISKPLRLRAPLGTVRIGEQ